VIKLLERVAVRPDMRRLPLAAGDFRRADITAVRRELGWQPRVELREASALSWQWALSRVAAS
jgi:nucleoside-diphosphate-sugar epimerase